MPDFSALYEAAGEVRLQQTAFGGPQQMLTRPPLTPKQIFSPPPLKPLGTPYDRIFHKAASTYGIPVGWITAVAKAESGFNKRARSPVGAMGVMQLMPGTARSLGVKNAFDPEQNIMGGARYLAQLYKKYNGDMKRATAAYNAGPGNVDKYGGVPPFKETRGYVDKIGKRIGGYPGSVKAAAQKVPASYPDTFAKTLPANLFKPNTCGTYVRKVITTYGWKGKGIEDIKNPNFGTRLSKQSQLRPGDVVFLKPGGKGTTRHWALVMKDSKGRLTLNELITNTNNKWAQIPGRDVHVSTNRTLGSVSSRITGMWRPKLPQGSGASVPISAKPTPAPSGFREAITKSQQVFNDPRGVFQKPILTVDSFGGVIANGPIGKFLNMDGGEALKMFLAPEPSPRLRKVTEKIIKNHGMPTNLSLGELKTFITEDPTINALTMGVGMPPWGKGFMKGGQQAKRFAQIQKEIAEKEAQMTAHDRHIANLVEQQIQKGKTGKASLEKAIEQGQREMTPSEWAIKAQKIMEEKGVKLLSSPEGSRINNLSKTPMVIAKGKEGVTNVVGFGNRVEISGNLTPVEMIEYASMRIARAKMIAGEQPSAVDKFVDAIMASREAMTGWDISAGGRQAAPFLFSNPKEYTKAQMAGLRALKSEDFAQEAMSAIKNDEFYPILKKHGWAEREIGEPGMRNALEVSDDIHASRVMERVPGLIGKGYRASERSYNVNLNTLTYDVARKYAKNRMSGVTTGAQAELASKDIRAFINVVNNMAGHGSLGKYEAGAKLASALIFAPRLWIGRMKAIGNAVDLRHPAAAWQAMKGMGGMIGTGYALLATGDKLGWWKADLNPTSATFGNAIVGNHHIGMMGGMEKVFRDMSRLWTNSSTNPFTGAVNEGQPRDWFPRAASVVRGKMAPLPGAAIDFAAGEDITGQKIDKGDPMEIAARIGRLYSPMIGKDTYEGIQEGAQTDGTPGGVRGGLLAGIGSAIGIPVSSYGPFDNVDVSTKEGKDYWEGKLALAKAAKLPLVGAREPNGKKEKLFHEWSSAMIAGKTPNWEKFRTAYYEAGGSTESFKRSLSRLNPLYGFLSKEGQKKFKKVWPKLTKKERDKVRSAYSRYMKMKEDILAGRIPQASTPQGGGMTPEEAEAVLRGGR